MTAEQLRNSLLQEAISGRLVPQDPNEESASVLLKEAIEERKSLLLSKKIKKSDLSVSEIDEDLTFEIPNGWEWATIDSIAIVKGGKRIPVGKTFSPFPTPYIYIRVTEMKNNTLIDCEHKYISQELRDILQRYIIHSTDVYVTIAGTIGAVGDVPQKFDGMNLTENALKLSYLHVDKKYLIYALSSQFVQSQFKEKTNKVGQPKLAMERVKNTIFPLPPLAEQKRIVAKLEELLPIVEEYGKSQKDLEILNAELPARLRQSVLQEAISGRLVPQDPSEESAEGLLNHINKRRVALVKAKIIENKYGKELQIDADEYDVDLPKGWVICKLGNIAKITAGGTPARGIHKYWAGGNIPWLKISDITSSGKYVNSASEYITEEGVKNSSAKLMKKGTLLYTIFASIGEVAILNFEATCNQAIANIDLYEPEMTDYIYYYLKNLQAYMYSISKGCAQLNINQDILKNAIIPLPPLDEQKRIVAKLEEILPQIDKLGKL